MNWDAAGAIGEIVGALAVVISVIYLAVQIRRQTDQSRLAASRELATNWIESLNQLVESESFAELYLRASADYQSLPNTDRVRIMAHWGQIMRIIEQQYLHVKEGNIDPVFFDSSDQALVEWLRSPGVQQWWAIYRDVFSDEFCAFVDVRLASAKSQGYDSSFKNEREADQAIQS